MKKKSHPQRRLHFTPTPLFSWLILALAITTFFPRRVDTAGLTLLVVAALALCLNLSRSTVVTLVPYLATLTAALLIPIPLPDHWYPVSQLLITLLIWIVVLAALVTLTSRWFPTPGNNSPTTTPHRET